MNLLEFYNTFNPTPFSKSDKGTTHSYIQEYYSDEFSSLKDKEFNLIEIGAAHGNSIKLWREYFSKANITIIENMFQTTNEDLDRFKLIKGVEFILKDAYNKKTLELIKEDSIDYIIDDGPHSLSTQKLCVDLYYSKLKTGGKIIIEDVNGNNLDLLTSHIKNLNLPHKVYDLRSSKGRYDDIIIEINKI